MRSFTPAFIAAALATLVRAAPVYLPAGRSVSVPSVPAANLNSLPLPGSNGQLGFAKGAVGSVAEALVGRSEHTDALKALALKSETDRFTGTVKARSKLSDALKSLALDSEVSGFTGTVKARSKFTESLEGELAGLRTRADTPSVALISASILIEIQPYIEKLTYITASNCTLTEITDVVAAIKAPILAAIPELHALVGAEASIILAPVDASAGDVELTVSEVAAIVGVDVDLVLAAAGTVLTVAEAGASEIVADVEVVLTDLGNTVTSLVEAVVVLADGLAASLAPVVAPVDDVIVELKLTALASLLDISA
ncbi:hypothetical protein OG21DRAFT_1494950 [Imleria badia]|nr:hypothetical protein OG21DRAFT_1494950 [Imleria badia]